MYPLARGPTYKMDRMGLSFTHQVSGIGKEQKSERKFCAKPMNHKLRKHSNKEEFEAYANIIKSASRACHKEGDPTIPSSGVPEDDQPLLPGIDDKEVIE